MVTIRISPVAWMKMQTLVTGYDKEVGWFGTCEELGPLNFRIKDILIFPQYTSGCYIDDERDDPMEFRNWLDTLTDEQYEQRRLWGHSHVNMGVSPSGTDTSMFKRFAETNCAALVNRFAICLIMNKRAEMHWWVFDGATNKEYKKNEINVLIEVEQGMSNLEFFESTKEFVRDIRPTTAFLFSSGYSYGSYGGSRGTVFGSNHETAPGYNYGGYNSYIKEREESEKKKEANISKKDNEVQNPFHMVVYDEEDDDDNPFAGIDDYPYENWAYESWTAYDIIIEKDGITVEEADANKYNEKRDVIIEDYCSGDEYRFIICDEPLVENHPLSDTSVAMALLKRVKMDPENRYFVAYEVRGDSLKQLCPFDEHEVLDLMTMDVSDIDQKDGDPCAMVIVERNGVKE